MLLCKVLQGSASEVGAILAGKWGVKHTGAELDAMSEVAKSAKNRCESVSACCCCCCCCRRPDGACTALPPLSVSVLNYQLPVPSYRFWPSRTTPLCTKCFEACVCVFCYCFDFCRTDGWMDSTRRLTARFLRNLFLLVGLWKSSTLPFRCTGRRWRRTCSSSTTWGSCTTSFSSPTCSRSSRYVCMLMFLCFATDKSLDSFRCMHPGL